MRTRLNVLDQAQKAWLWLAPQSGVYLDLGVGIGIGVAFGIAIGSQGASSLTLIGSTGLRITTSIAIPIPTPTPMVRLGFAIHDFDGSFRPFFSGPP
jgi:hypothetical protein